MSLAMRPAITVVMRSVDSRKDQRVKSVWVVKQNVFSVFNGVGSIYQYDPDIDTNFIEIPHPLPAPPGQTR